MHIPLVLAQGVKVLVDTITMLALHPLLTSVLCLDMPCDG